MSQRYNAEYDESRTTSQPTRYLHEYCVILLGATKRGLINLRFIMFLNFPYCINICLLVWDSVLQLVHEH